MWVVWSVTAPAPPTLDLLIGRWSDPEPSGCGTGLAYVFFISFTLIVSFVMLNVFVAVVLEQFATISAKVGRGVVHGCAQLRVRVRVCPFCT
jgi:hypothetical protein